MADAEMLATLNRVAALFEAILYNPGKTYEAPRIGPQRYLFVTDPPDYRFWRPGDDINIVRLSDNKPVTFWAFIAEKAGDAAFTTKARSWARSPHLVDALTKFQVDEQLPGGGRLTLQHAPIPPNFDVTLLQAYGIPSYPHSSISSSLLHTVQHAVESGRKTSEDVLATYDTIRAWAEASGIFSKQLGPMNAKVLADLVLAVPYSDDGVSQFLRQYAADSAVMSAVKSYPENFYKSDISFISEEVAKLENDTDKLRVFHQHQTVRFREEYEDFVEVRLRTWGSLRTRPQAWNQLLTLLPVLRHELTSRADLKLRVWPSLFALKEAVVNEQCLILLLGVQVKTKAILQAIREILETFTQRYTGDLEADNYLIHINLETQATVQDSSPLEGQRDLNWPLNHSSSESHEAQLPVSLQIASEKTRFRTAGQTLSRLKWHPGHKLEKYDVGYLDRFDGLIWLPLENWVKAVEDEDFIPEHRILQFRRRDNKVIVWDRPKRIDLTGQVD